MAVYKIGSSGDDVAKLQEQLKAAGFDPGGIDGQYGPNTEAAVTAYQKAKGLDVDGIAGSQTLGSLTRTAQTTPIPSAADQKIASEEYQWGKLDPAYANAIKTGTETDFFKNLNNTMQAMQPVQSSVPAINNTPQITTTAQPAPIDYSGLSNIKFNMPEAPAAYVDPFAEKLTAALDKILGYDVSSPIDVTKDPLYNPLKQQYEQMGESAFNNQIGRLSALTGGRPSTAAVGTATGAQNAYAKQFEGTVLPGLIQNAQTQRQNVISNLYSQLEALQGMRNDSYGQYRDTVGDYQKDRSFGYDVATDNRDFNYGVSRDNVADTRYNTGEQERLVDKSKQEWLDNIGQFSDNFQLEINRITNNTDTTDDWKIPYLKKARQDKIAGIELGKAEAEKTAYERGIEQQKLANDTRYTDAQISNMKADNARAWATVNEANGTKAEQKARDDQYNAEFKKMMSAADPAAYLDGVKANLYPEVYANLSKFTGKESTPGTFGPLYSSMMSAPDPAAWLKENAIDLENDELKYLEGILKTEDESAFAKYIQSQLGG
jgi:peptidoglycan hydrolase-like protein with peptidoglycan-binding domain